MYLIPDPTRITDFEQSDNQLEMSLVFWVLVAGKTAHVVVRQMETLIQDFFSGVGVGGGTEASILNAIASYSLPSIQAKLQRAGIGCWKLKADALFELSRSSLNLRTCSVQDLESIRGIGPKTARCFVLHSRRDARVAGLDTHILRYCAESGYRVPRTTPGSRASYARVEAIVLDLADQHNMTPAEFDLWVWNQYSRKKNQSPAVQNA